MVSKNISDKNLGTDSEGLQKVGENAPETSSLSENFRRYFAVEYAANSEQKQRVYRMRYRVYCEEFRYESMDRFPDKMEHDEFDANAFHCLISHRRSGMPAGCVRLVPTKGDLETTPLPFEKHCLKSLDWKFINSLGVRRNTVCEVSRLAVDGVFRRRSGEALTRFGEVDAMDFSRQEQRSFSLIAVAGFLAATALTDLTGRTNVFAMMEPFLPRLMKRSGIIFQKAGIDIDYHGIRAPYFIRTQTVLDSIRPELRDLYDWIRTEIGKSYRASSGYQQHETP